MAKFRKKPVVIEAIRWDGLPDLNEMLGPAAKAETARLQRFDDWMVKHQSERKCRYVGDTVVIPTLAGDMTASPGDWIIQGVKGELYPCKPDIFDATYEAVDDG